MGSKLLIQRELFILPVPRAFQLLQLTFFILLILCAELSTSDVYFILGLLSAELSRVIIAKYQQARSQWVPTPYS